jgi:hypothetical protein
MASHDKSLHAELDLLRSLASKRRAESFQLTRRRMMATHRAAAAAAAAVAPVAAPAAAAEKAPAVHRDAA